MLLLFRQRNFELIVKNYSQSSTVSDMSNIADHPKSHVPPPPLVIAVNDGIKYGQNAFDKLLRNISDQ